MIRRSAAATQSMFSVPESIAIRAPEDSANHSTGTPSSSARSSAAMIRRHSGSATEPSAFVGSPSRTTRCMPSGWRSVNERVTPTTIPASFIAGGRSAGHEVTVGVEVVLDELAARDPARAVGALGRQHLDQLGRVHGAAPAGLHDPPRALVERLQRPRRRLVELHDHAAAGGREQAQLAVVELPVARVAACGRG